MLAENQLNRLIRIIFAISLILSSLGIGEDTNGLFEGFVASLLECRGRRLKVVRSLLVQCHREFGSSLLAVKQVSLNET